MDHLIVQSGTETTVSTTANLPMTRGLGGPGGLLVFQAGKNLERKFIVDTRWKAVLWLGRCRRRTECLPISVLVIRSLLII